MRELPGEKKQRFLNELAEIVNRTDLSDEAKKALIQIAKIKAGDVK